MSKVSNIMKKINYQTKTSLFRVTWRYVLVIVMKLYFRACSVLSLPPWLFCPPQHQLHSLFLRVLLWPLEVPLLLTLLQDWLLGLQALLSSPPMPSLLARSCWPRRPFWPPTLPAKKRPEGGELELVGWRYSSILNYQKCHNYHI